VTRHRTAVDHARAGGSNGLDRFRASNSYQMLERRANAGVAYVTPVHYWDTSPNTQIVTHGQRRATQNGRAAGGPRRRAGGPEPGNGAAGALRAHV